MRKALYLIFFLVSTHSIAEQFDLNKSIQFGIKNSPKIKNANTALNSAILAKDSARSPFWPSLDFVSKHGYTDTDPELQAKPEVSEFSLVLSQNLFNNMRDEYQLQSAKALESSASESQIETKSQLILDIHLAMFNYSTDIKKLENARLKNRLISEQFKILEKSYKSGFKPRTDYLRFKAQYQQSIIDLENLENSLKQTAENFAVVIGYEKTGQLKLKPLEPSYKKLPAIDRTDVDVKKHFSYKKLEFVKISQAYLAKVALKNDHPVITFNIDATYGAQNYLGDPRYDIDEVDQTQMRAYVAISYNIFDFNKGVNDFDKAVNDRVIAENNVYQAGLEIKRDNHNLVRTLELLTKTAKLNLELFQLEQSNYDLLKAKYQQGQANVLELTTALQNLERANNDYVTAYFKILSVKANLWHHQRRFATESIYLPL